MLRARAFASDFQKPDQNVLSEKLSEST
jgi:hypothetical protein